jgi:class 3 adenylate cyclase
VKSQGDGFMVCFTSARAGVSCAVSIQQDCRAQARLDPDTELRVRLGVHTGEAINARDGDLFGRHVVIAARIADAAEGGQILVSALVRELAAGRDDLHFGPPRTVHLKGLGEHVVHEVLWGDQAPPARDC